MLSVGESSAVSDALPNDAGVQEQVALPALDATAEHPEMVEPATLKATDPG